jgi:glycosyltransferase involved in cell wall biosynthesis
VDSWGNRRASLFHGLNQRLPSCGFKRQIATFHDLFVLSGNYSTAEFRERFAAQARQAAAGADLIIAVSEFTAGQVEHYLKVPRERIRVVHHGVLQRAIPKLAREKIVLCVGAIQRRKNQAGLIKAFRAMPAGWKLVLAGSLGYGADEVMREIEQSPQRDDIRITGYLTDDELGRWYGRASIFAFPSLDEGFGMPTLEAMAAGVPVISGNRSALPEVCGEAALIVDPESEDELAGALIRLATDRELCEELSRKGRARAANFSWSGAVFGTLKVYGELLGV